MYYKNCDYTADGELFARFTAFMKKVIISAKVDYIRRQRHWKREVLMDELPELFDESHRLNQGVTTTMTSGFSFTEDRLTVALSTLGAQQRRILEFSYINELSAQEIAAILGCPVKAVYNQKYTALKKLRKVLLNGGEKDV